jgi:hypothetical protein
MLLHNPVQRPSAADVVHRLEALQGMHMVLDIDNDVRNAEGHATVSVVLRVEVRALSMPLAPTPVTCTCSLHLTMPPLG